VVTDTGVAVGPSIDSSAALTASCGVPFTANLVGSGDAPLVWSLRSGPAGLLVDAAGPSTGRRAALAPRRRWWT
jgi:hypothetical protein